MDAALQSGLFALAGVLIGGLATHFFSLQRERENRKFIKQNQDDEIRRQRLEELYKAVTQWALNVSTVSIPWMMSMQGKIDYNDAQEMATKNISTKDTDPHIIEMLIFIYASNTITLHEKCVQNLAAANDYLIQFKQFYEQNGQFSVFPLIDDYLNACTEFETTSSMLKRKIAEQIKQI